MKKSMLTVQETSELINKGSILSIAGDENLLVKLPKGNWIGGTIPYFISENGGEINKKLLYVTPLDDNQIKYQIIEYDEKSISSIYLDAYENGYSIIIIPGLSQTHFNFSLKSSRYKNFAISPLIGWISGVDLNDLGKVTPKVFNGETGEFFENKAIVLHLELPKNKYAEIDIVNIFTQNLQGDKIEFLEDSFTVSDVLINEEKVNFATYVKENKLNIKLPLVADFNGAIINTSFQSVNEDDKIVTFFAPVFSGVKYYQALNVENYVENFLLELPKNIDPPIFSCNCILNYIYSELEGKKTSNFTGPITFGEIAYQLLNQTMTFIEIKETN
jgi:hypothetical protein